MNTQCSLRIGRSATAAIALALLFGCASVPALAGPTKPSAPAKPAAKPSAPAARPSGGAKPAAPTAGHSGTTTAGHTTTTTAGHTTTTTAGHTTATTGGHTTAAGTGGVGAGHTASIAAPHGTTASPHFSSATPKGSAEHATKTGSAVRTRPGGKISDVHDAKRGIDVHHNLDGSRRVSHELPNHGRMVAERGRPGYVQRGYAYHGHDFGRRAYYYHGQEYNRYYRGYGYNGVYLNVYAPGYYYNPGFYGWAYNPWAAPISFGWGWGASPWYGFYGGFFNPYPVYASAAFWLTDYIISQDLQAAYAAHQEAQVAVGEQAAAGAPPALTPEVKQQIADEVKAQIALENQEATQTAANQDVDPGSSGIARMLGDGQPHVFVVGDGLDLTDANGAECAVSEGDALKLVTPPPADATTADLVVLASKGGKECASAATVAVKLDDLQEMQNHMRETIDQGLKDLQAKQGTGGLPAAPASAKAAPTESPYAAVAPPPDPKDATDLQQTAKDADASEQEVVAAASAENGSPIGSVAPSGPSASGPPPSVALGQSMDEVKSILGNPTKTANLGVKTIYYYDGMKVIFKAGKVTDVE